MKALIRKDLYTTLASLRTIFLIMAVFAVTTVLAENTGFYIPYLVVLPGTLASTLISLDGREKWSVYALTLPVSRRTVVAARYVFVLLLILCGGLLGSVCFLLRSLRGYESTGIAGAIAMCLAAGLVVPSITIPMAYRFGAEKGRYLVIFLIMGLMLGMMSLSLDGYSLSGALSWMGPWTMLFAAALLYAVSWAAATSIYEKKEIA